MIRPCLQCKEELGPLSPDVKEGSPVPVMMKVTIGASEPAEESVTASVVLCQAHELALRNGLSGQLELLRKSLTGGE